jgi:hypothetical protein
MDREDPKESEKEDRKGKKPMRDTTKMAAAVAVTATVFSPTVRAVLRRGAVQGVAGVLMLADAIGSFARGVGRGIRDANAPGATAAAGEGAASAALAVEAAQEAARAAQEAARAAQQAAEAARSATAGSDAPRRSRKPRTRPSDPEEGGKNPDE